MQTDRKEKLSAGQPETNTSPILVVLAWLFVAIPAGWGIYNTLLNALKLFHAN